MSVSASDIRESEPNPNAAPPVFISHSYVDAAWKERIAGSLASRSVAVWAASYTRTTNSWDEETQHAIDNAPVVVLLISPHYFNSQAIQGREIPYLLAQKKRLFAVLVDYCEWQKVDWLTGIQMFPSNGRPLSAVDSIEMESYLASAAIEISSLAGIANTVQTASAKVSDLDGRFVGMATLVNADVAIAVFPSDMKEATFNLEFSGIGFTSVARRLLDDSNLTLLSLSSPAYWEIPVSTIVPPSGTVWECMSFPSASDAGVVTTGTILGVVTRNGREYLHLKLSIVVNESRGMAGAAIVVEGRVVAILESQGAILDEWFAVPLQSIASSTIWAEAFSGNLSTSSEGASLRPTPEVPSSTNIPTSSATATPAPTPVDSELEFDRSGFVTRLTPDAVAALLRADGYRLALRQKRLHMEHLLLGLYGQADSPIRRLARDAKIYDERSFQRFFSKANPGLKGDVSPRPPVPPLVLPELSAHVREALITAQKIGGQRIGRVSLLNGALSVNCGALSGLRSLEPPPRAEESIGLRDWIIGVSSDVPGGRDEDLLNLKRDVNALCSVIAAADAHLPLSIGLFGEWGSGKSFFMNMMEQRLVDLQKVGPPTFCSRIVQLKFNAWHYMDTSLWASLTSEIFEGLATTLSTSTGPEPTNKAAELLVDVSTSRDRLADAERQSESAKIKLAESEARLRALASGEAEIRASLSPRLLFTEAAHLAFEQKEVKDEFDKAARELNLSQAVGAGADVNKELLELRGIFNAMFVAMRNTERLWVWLVALVLVASVSFGIPVIARSYFHDQWDYVRTAITTAATFLAGIAALLAPFFVPARRALKYLQDARTKSEDLIRKKKEEKYKELKTQYDKRKEEVDKQEETVKRERETLVVLQEAVDKLRADRQMLDFIKSRNASTDYTSHLGVVARAHKDFKELSAFLARVAEEPPQSDLPRVDRIVLYIDDLDRCPEDKVMDVLQAVHLLLAFPLFVVVVGVDPRWLLHSVAARATPLRQGVADENGFGQSTPLDYLEKIFQIPFTLSPMSATGFGSLVDKVAGSDQIDRKLHSPTHAAPASGIKPKLVVDNPKVETEAASTPTFRSIEAPSTVSVPRAPMKIAEEVRSAAEPLKIEPWEREFMKQLYCLIPSPRAGKRFINIYRMIRSTVDGAQWQQFVGNERQGDYRQAMLLLAILTGYPGEAAEILRQLIERVHNETWWEFVETCNATGNKWIELRMKLQSLRSLVSDTEGCDVFRQYAPWVARYSFQSGRVLLALQLPEADT